MTVIRRGCTSGGGLRNFCVDEEKNDSNVKCMICNQDSCNSGIVNCPKIFFIGFSLIALVTSLVLS